MSRESDAASKIYERNGERTRQVDRAVTAMNKRHASRAKRT
jgi:hypothetical protein